MKKQNSKHYIDGLMGLLALCIFAGCILAVLLAGAKAYRGLTARDQSSYENRSCAQYVALKLRQAASPEAVSLCSLGDTDALCIAEEIDDREYYTLVYCSDGWLRELLTAGLDTADPKAGEKLIELDAMDFDLSDGLLAVTYTDARGMQTQLHLALRGEGGTP